jgi:hypothetical protein
MPRRRFEPDPMSRLAIWARRLAIFALVAAILSTIIVRSGVLDILPALATFGGALAIAALAILIALASLAVIWHTGARGLGAAFTAIGLALLLLAYPLYLGFQALTLPALTDVSTDVTDPPRYDVLARLRERDANPADYPGEEIARIQRASFPDIESYIVEATPQQVYDAALAVINKRRWRIVDERPPQAGRRDGHIEAVARTLIMGFREDVVVRIRATPDGAQIDARSSSRYGPHDFGSNAARIRTLLEEVDEVLATPTPARPTPPPSKSAPKPGPGSRVQTDKR